MDVAALACGVRELVAVRVAVAPADRARACAAAPLVAFLTPATLAPGTAAVPCRATPDDDFADDPAAARGFTIPEPAAAVFPRSELPAFGLSFSTRCLPTTRFPAACTATEAAAVFRFPAFAAVAGTAATFRFPAFVTAAGTAATFRFPAFVTAAGTAATFRFPAFAAAAGTAAAFRPRVATGSATTVSERFARTTGVPAPRPEAAPTAFLEFVLLETADAGFVTPAAVPAVARPAWRLVAPEAPEAAPARPADAAGAAAARLPVPEGVVLGLRPAPEAAGLVGAFLAAGIEVFLLAE